MKKALLLLPLIVGACHQAPGQDCTIESLASNWAGAYSKPNGYRGTSLELKPDGAFIITVSTRDVFFSEVMKGSWSQSENMVYLEPDEPSATVWPYRSLKKVIEDGDHFLTPSGSNDLLSTQRESILRFSFFGGTADRRSYHQTKEWYSMLIDSGFTLESIQTEGGATMDELAEMGLLEKLKM